MAVGAACRKSQSSEQSLKHIEQQVESEIVYDQKERRPESSVQVLHTVVTIRDSTKIEQNLPNPLEQ